MAGLRVGIVGAGPAGLYTVDALLAEPAIDVSIDVFDALPTPFGLLRYGVAPDHLKMKSLATALQKLLDDPRVHFFGNVQIGRDVSVNELRSAYDVVVYAFGAADDRRLGIPGEDLNGSVAATDFVAWYCGHPDTALETHLHRATGAAIVGVGNVAVDLARILTKDAAELSHTDMPQPVLDVLSSSTLTDVHVLGRRGPAAAKFTSKELRELGELAGVDVVVRADELLLDDDQAAIVAADPVRRRNLDVLRDWSTRALTGASRRLHVRFQLRPVEVLGKARVSGLRVERTDSDGSAASTGEVEVLDVGLVLRAVGYRGSGVQGVPLDDVRGSVPADALGRVLRDGRASRGEYVAGWLKRGPVGVLGTNRADGLDVVAAVVADAPTLGEHSCAERTQVPALLRARGIEVVSADGWSAIDAAESVLGAQRGRARTKIDKRAALLDASRAC